MLPGFSPGFTTCSVNASVPHPLRSPFHWTAICFSVFFSVFCWFFYRVFCALFPLGSAASIFIWSELRTQLPHEASAENQFVIKTENDDDGHESLSFVFSVPKRCWHITPAWDVVELEQLLSINFMQINRETQQRWELSPKALKGDVKMKHCITVNYARAHNAEIALSTSKRSPFPLFPCSATALPDGALALPARRDNDNGIRTRMSCDSESKVSYNYRVAGKGVEGGVTAAKTDEQFMTCRFCAAFNIFLAVVLVHICKWQLISKREANLKSNPDRVATKLPYVP